MELLDKIFEADNKLVLEGDELQQVQYFVSEFLKYERFKHFIADHFYKNPYDWEALEEGFDQLIDDMSGSCADCQCDDYEMYMVQDDLWYEIQPKGDKIKSLCLTCFRKKICRDLTLADFPGPPCNDWINQNVLDQINFKATRGQTGSTEEIYENLFTPK